MAYLRDFLDKERQQNLSAQQIGAGQTVSAGMQAPVQKTMGAPATVGAGGNGKAQAAQTVQAAPQPVPQQGQAVPAEAKIGYEPWLSGGARPPEALVPKNPPANYTPVAKSSPENYTPPTNAKEGDFFQPGNAVHNGASIAQANSPLSYHNGKWGSATPEEIKNNLFKIWGGAGPGLPPAVGPGSVNPIRGDLDAQNKLAGLSNVFTKPQINAGPGYLDPNKPLIFPLGGNDPQMEAIRKFQESLPYKEALKDNPNLTREEYDRLHPKFMEIDPRYEKFKNEQKNKKIL